MVPVRPHARPTLRLRRESALLFGRSTAFRSLILSSYPLPFVAADYSSLGAFPSLKRRGLEFRHFGLRFLNKSLSFSRNLRPAWMRQTFRTDSCAAASAYPARRGGGVAIFSILAVERNDAFGQARCAANKLRAPCCNKRL